MPPEWAGVRRWPAVDFYTPYSSLTKGLRCHRDAPDRLTNTLGKFVGAWAEVLRFCLVGGFATLTHLGVAALLVQRFASLNVFTVNLLAFTCAFWVSFAGHRYFTFRTKGSVLKFLVSSLVGLAVNNTFLAVAFWMSSAELLSIVTAATIAPVVVFILSRFWVFK